MPTFKRTPEIVDARLFEGGIENGTGLVKWAQANDVTLMWVDEHLIWRSGDRRGMQPEQIRLFDQHGGVIGKAFIGDWIMQRQSGVFEVVRPQELEADYELL